VEIAFHGWFSLDQYHLLFNFIHFMFPNQKQPGNSTHIPCTVTELLSVRSSFFVHFYAGRRTLTAPATKSVVIGQ
jgi:hypothetical protein